MVRGEISISGLLAVVSMACVLKMKSSSFVSKRLSEKFGNYMACGRGYSFCTCRCSSRYTIHFKCRYCSDNYDIVCSRISILRGVNLCCKHKSKLEKRIFCVIAYLPKATVQAAIGSVPLAAGLPCGKIILSVAVMAIVITAPIGAFGMDYTYQKFLSKGERM